MPKSLWSNVTSADWHCAMQVGKSFALRPQLLFGQAGLVIHLEQSFSEMFRNFLIASKKAFSLERISINKQAIMVPHVLLHCFHNHNADTDIQMQNKTKGKTKHFNCFEFSRIALLRKSTSQMHLFFFFANQLIQYTQAHTKTSAKFCDSFVSVQFAKISQNWGQPSWNRVRIACRSDTGSSCINTHTHTQHQHILPSTKRGAISLQQLWFLSSKGFSVLIVSRKTIWQRKLQERKELGEHPFYNLRLSTSAADGAHFTTG